jgi:hypothetical protein
MLGEEAKAIIQAMRKGDYLTIDKNAVELRIPLQGFNAAYKEAMKGRRQN